MNKIEKLKAYCTARLETENKALEFLMRCAWERESESPSYKPYEVSIHDLRVRIVEIEGFLLLLNMDDPVWGESA